MSNQWLHTEAHPEHPERYPLAPWASHPEADLDRDLLAELLSTLRDDVISWTEIAAESGSSAYAQHRVEGAVAALKLADRLAGRSARRGALRREAGL